MKLPAAASLSGCTFHFQTALLADRCGTTKQTVSTCTAKATRKESSHSCFFLVSNVAIRSLRPWRTNNHSTKIPSCVAYRFHCVLQIVERLLVGHHFELSEADITQIVDRTRGYSGSDMSYLCKV